MPFKSRAQQRYLYARRPDIAKRFASYGVPKNLPERARKRQRSKTSRD